MGPKRDLCALTGSYNVILDESHFKDLLTFHVKPPPASSSSECSLIRMGNTTPSTLTHQSAGFITFVYNLIIIIIT